MRLIGITHEEIALRDEWRIICAALEADELTTIHLRKPRATEIEVAKLLRQIPHKLHSRIVLHDHFALLDEFELQGIHLNRRHPTPPAEYCGQLSCSCHSIEEIRALKRCGKLSNEIEYAFLSPIFSSISKRGYESQFTLQQLAEAHDEGVIDKDVVALGGITPQNMERALRCGFGGVAVLGYLWQEWNEESTRRCIKELIKALKTERECYNL